MPEALIVHAEDVRVLQGGQRGALALEARLAVDEDRARQAVGGRLGQEPEQRLGGDALAAAGLPDEAERLTATQNRIEQFERGAARVNSGWLGHCCPAP